MSTVMAAEPGARTAFRPSFYFWMTLLMAFFVFSGFGMTYWYPLASGTFPEAPFVVHLHGAVYFTWIILLVTQSALVNSRNVALHRSLGMYGIAHATLVIVMGSLITILGASGVVEPLGNHGIFLGITAVTGFGLLFTLAIRNRTRPQVHRRLILFAMLPILPPGIHRLYMTPFGMTSFPVVPMYITLNLMALAIIVHEWRTSHAISKYTWIGAGWLVFQQILHASLINTEFFGNIVLALGSIAHYR
jgi:hypothetical protein